MFHMMDGYRDNIYITILTLLVLYINIVCADEYSLVFYLFSYEVILHGITLQGALVDYWFHHALSEFFN